MITQLAQLPQLAGASPTGRGFTINANTSLLLAEQPGKQWLLWSFSAGDNPPSMLNPYTIRYGYDEQFLSRNVRSLKPSTADEALYHLPLGGIHGQDMPFHSAQLCRERRMYKVLGTFPIVVLETAQRMSKLPWVYLGNLSAHFFWTNTWRAWDFEDQVWEAIRPFTDSQGRPTAKIAIDTAGVQDRRSLEWQAYLLLRKWGLTVGYEPRPHVTTDWGEYDELTGFTTDQLLRVTGEGGTGRGGDWAVPFADMRSEQVVLDITDSDIEYLAQHSARGRGVTFVGSEYSQWGDRPEKASRVYERALAIIAGQGTDAN